MMLNRRFHIDDAASRPLRPNSGGSGFSAQNSGRWQSIRENGCVVEHQRRHPLQWVMAVGRTPCAQSAEIDLLLPISIDFGEKNAHPAAGWARGHRQVSFRVPFVSATARDLRAILKEAASRQSSVKQ